jgi:hypothetical protein
MRHASELPPVAPSVPTGQRAPAQYAMHSAMSAYCALAPVQLVMSCEQ